MRGRPNGAFIGPAYQERLALKLKERLEANGFLAGGEGTGVFGRLTNRIKEAQRVVELAATEGYFDDVSASDIQDCEGSNVVFKDRMREAALEMLADQYPELDVEVRFGDRNTFSRFFGEIDNEFRKRVTSRVRGGLSFRVFNRGVGR